MQRLPLTPCKIWTGAKNSHGYGQRRIKGKIYAVHRLAWSEAHGPIPLGGVICHSCDVPACYEETHLFLGTQADNIRDMEEKGRDNRRGQSKKTHCPSGHEYTEENTHITRRMRNGKEYAERKCRACHAALERRRRADARRRRQLPGS